MEDEAFVWLPLLGKNGKCRGYTKLHPEDAARLAGLWRLAARQYVVCKYNGRTVYLHRVVMRLAPDDPREVDHINRDTLDNRRCNLRLATSSENRQNAGYDRGGTSQHRGVCWVTRRKKWRASCRVDGRTIYGGFFDDEQEAARVAAALRAEHLPFAVR